jgi:hypothetical protein
MGVVRMGERELGHRRCVRLLLSEALWFEVLGG